MSAELDVSKINVYVVEGQPEDQLLVSKITIYAIEASTVPAAAMPQGQIIGYRSALWL